MKMIPRSLRTWHRKLLLLLAVGVLLATSAVFVVGSASNHDKGFKPAGSWVFVSNAPLGSLPSLVTYTQDGLAISSDVSMFRTLIGDGKLSPYHGVWERTGRKSFGGTSLYMRYNSEGTLVGFARARGALHFVGDPDHIEGVMFIDIGPPCSSPPFGCPDPLSPDAIWTPLPFQPPGGFPISATRIRRVEVPE